MIAVKGANGQLGKTLFEKLGSEATFFDKKTLDITSPVEVDKVIGALPKGSIIINTAAYTDVEKAEDEPELAFSVNELGPKNLAVYCVKYGHFLIHVSTDYVFDGKVERPLRESDPVNALGIYGKSKLAGERAVMEAGNNYLILRTSWLHGPHRKNFVKTMLSLRNRESINVVDDQIGSPCYVGDLADVIIEISKRKELINGSIYHYSNGGQCSWYEFAKEIMSQTDSKCIVRPIATSEYPTKVNRPKFTVLDKSKITNTLKVKVPHWTEGLKKCLNQISY